MSDDLAGAERVVSYSYDVDGPLYQFEQGQDGAGGVTPTYTYKASTPPPVRFAHDPDARVLRLTAADGSVEVFRDNPTRYLCVEPDPRTGAMRPVLQRGRPVYLNLCREEREVR